MEAEEAVKAKQTDRWAQIIITECICVGIILISVLVIKYFFKDTYNELKVWYEKNICDTTEISEVLETEGGLDEV